MPLQQTRVDVFESIFLVFLGLGTLVGIVVVSYMLYNAYKYRDTGETKADDSLPTLGELPTGGKGGKKLFLSFGISAIIVISLVIWTYGMLLYVEDPADEFDEEPTEIEVVGEGFAWHFEYENGAETTGTMTIPANKPILIQTTGGDVWHTFGIPDLRVKADAIPGEYDETWFMAEEAGTQHRIQCFELCGPLHSDMTGTVEVMEQDEFDQWLNEQISLEVTIEDQNESPVTEGYELQLVHQNNSEFEQDLEYTYTADDFDNGTITVDELEQGGTYDLTIEFENGEYETIEDSIEITSPESETYTVGEEEESENGSEEGGDGGNGSDEEQSDGDDTGNDEQTDDNSSDGGDGE